MANRATERLLADFREAVVGRLPVRAVWAHGSLGAGDYVEGRSDLDLVVVPDGPAETDAVEEVHHAVARAHPLAMGLHCSYLAPGELDDPDRDHLTWAHQELFHRPVTPVTRRELHCSARVLHGPPPKGLLPEVDDAALAAFIRRDLAGYWHPHLDRPGLWLRDVWVDLGMVTYARATVTLRTGELLTKRQALDVLDESDAPSEVVADIRARRYGRPHRTGPHWRVRRARLTRAYLAPALARTLVTAPPT